MQRPFSIEVKTLEEIRDDIEVFFFKWRLFYLKNAFVSGFCVLCNIICPLTYNRNFLTSGDQNSIHWIICIFTPNYHCVYLFKDFYTVKINNKIQAKLRVIIFLDIKVEIE